jgi:Arc/MetJ family transcription regulator
MRCNFDIDEALLRKALKASGLSSERAVVEEGLRLLLKVKGQEGIRRLRGKITFEGNVRELDKAERSS